MVSVNPRHANIYRDNIYKVVLSSSKWELTKWLINLFLNVKKMKYI